jgi:hypothetical protein
MSRVLALGGIALTIAASVGLYQVKYQVQGMERDLAQMKRDVARDRGEIQVLEAEWSYLNQPERLQDLANRYLSLTPATTAQMAAIEDLPPRALAPAPGVADAGTAMPTKAPQGKVQAAKPGTKAKPAPATATLAKAEIAKAKPAAKAPATARVATAPASIPAPVPSLAVRAPSGLTAGVPAAATVMVSGGAVAPAPLQGGDDE